MGLNVGSLAGSVVSGVPIVGPVLGDIIGGLFGGGAAPDGRYASNQYAYQAALAGNPNGVIALKGHAGLGDGVLTGPIPGIPNYKAGSRMIAWPADGPRADAAAKYSQVIASAQAGAGGAATAVGPQGNTPAAEAAEALKKEYAGVPLWLGIALFGAGFLLLTKRR